EYGLTNVSGLYDRTRYYKEKSSSNNLKFVFMMGYVKTNADILNWYMSNPNSDMNLVQAFRSAMTVPANQQQNNQQNAPAQNMLNPLNLSASSQSSASGSNGGDSGSSNSGSSNESNSDVDDVMGGAENNDGANNANSGYSEPLGVSETFENTSSETPVNVALALTATAAAVTGATAFALTRSSNEAKEEKPE
ncbi:hypothetical protein IIW29_02090, partial [Candidatus Saccharibacteria bacterium]|nr:hypothetical protein [Candidatus Saccharibacteria bacterium]